MSLLQSHAVLQPNALQATMLYRYLICIFVAFIVHYCGCVTETAFISNSCLLKTKMFHTGIC